MKKTNQIVIILLLLLSHFVFAQDETKTNPLKSKNTIHWGVNIHVGGNYPGNLANVISKRNLNYVRMDLEVRKPEDLSKFVNAARIMKSKGIKITAILFSEFALNRSRDKDYSADLTEVEKTAYEHVKLHILQTKDYVAEYELQNEVPLYPNIRKADSTGQTAADFDTPAGRLQAAALKGMANAVNDIRKSYKLPIRIILGTVDRRFGFLTFMQQQGVIFDVVAYHVYPWENHKPLDTDPWFGTGGALGQLAQFNKPILINEFNSGEIYQGGSGHPGIDYENTAGKDVTEAGFRSLYKHLSEIVNQTVANVEGVYFYEINDEPNKAKPENRFGLFYDEKLNNPKISLCIATAFAGGKLSKAERMLLISRGFIYNLGVK